MSQSAKTYLDSIWPKADWASNINDERPDELLNLLAALYEGIRENPRKNEGSITDEQWNEAYVAGVRVLKAIFRKTRTVEDALTVNELFASRFGLNYYELQSMPLERSYVYWAISKGELPAESIHALKITEIAGSSIDHFEIGL